MNQADANTTHTTTTDQGAISILAARHAQLRTSGRDAPWGDVTDRLAALDELMLYGVPETRDEILTIIRLVWEGIDDDDPAAGALERVCEALERDGARNLRYANAT
jgi:hypothetical protein